MTSFAVAIEPAPAPRAAALAALAHFAAALAPWLARVPWAGAAAISLLAAGAFVATLVRLPGSHAPLSALVIDGRGCRARLAGSRALAPAELGPGSRAYPGLVVLDVRCGGRRLGWLLPRGMLPHADFRRLKARVRLAC